MRILIVDNHIDAADTLSELLCEFGYTTAIAHGSKEATASMPAMVPDVVICDLAMPGQNGLRLCAALRQEPTLADTSFIAWSGFSDVHTQERAREAGFDHYLVKGGSLRDLLELLGRIGNDRGGDRPSRGPEFQSRVLVSR